MHPLDGAYVRLRRAKKHLVELMFLNARIVNKEIEVMSKTLSVEAELGKFIPPGEKMTIARFERPEFPLPAELSSIIGDVLSNLRATLDYLVYELSALDSDGHKSGTQFPIEDTPDGFKRRRKTFLNGLNDSHAAAIEMLQPYNGVNWTKWLRVHSNPDKHRHLVVSKHVTRTETTSNADPANPPVPGEGIGGLLFTANVKLGDGRQMYMDFHITLLIAFEDGLPVVQTLQEIKTQVANTLADFKPEF